MSKTYAETLREIRTGAGWSRPKMVEKIGVPLRTIEDWEAGKSTPPEYVQRFVLKELSETLANDDRVVRCKHCKHYTATKYTETGFHCGLHSEGETYVTMCPDDFCSYGERDVAKSEPIIDRATFEQFQENLKARMTAKPSAAPTAAKKPRSTITHRQTSKIPAMPPLGYKWQDGTLAKDEAEAELIKRGYSEMAEHGQISMEAQREIKRALKAKLEAWIKENTKN